MGDAEKKDGIDPDEKELAELRARRAKAEAELAGLEAARQRRDRIAEERRRAEAAERAAKDATALAEAEEEHGPVGEKIAVVDTDLGAIIVKRPNPILFKRFQQSGSMKWDDIDKLIRPAVVYPDLSRFDQMLEELPATQLRVANVVVELAGARAKEVSGK